MIVHCLRVPLAGALLLFVHSASARAQPEPANDPLPKGAKVRFGITRPILRTNPHVALLGPGFTNFLAPTMTGGARRYDLGTGRPLDKDGIVGPGQVVASHDGKRAAVARPGTVSVVDAVKGNQILAVRPPNGVILVGVPGVSLSGDGKVLAFGGRGLDGKGIVVVWEVDRNLEIARMETELAAPVYPNLSRDGKTLVTHGPPPPAPTLDPKKKPPPMPKQDDHPDTLRTAQVWEVASGQELFKARVTGMGGMVVASAFSADGDLVAVSAADGPIDVYDVKNGKRVQTLLGRKGQGVRVAFSPDGKTIASVGPDYRIQHWRTDGKPLGVSDAPPGILIGQITGLTFADNQRAIAWLTVAQFAVAWDSPTGKLLSPQSDHLAAIRTIAFPKGGKDALTSGQDARVFRWDFATGALNEEIHVQPARLPAMPLFRPVVNLSSDAKRAIHLRAPAEVYDLTTGENLFCIPSPSSPPAPFNFAMSPDGLKVMTVSRQGVGKRTGVCTVWDLMTQQRLAEFEVPPSGNAAPPGAVMTPDGSKVLVGTVARLPTGLLALSLTTFDTKTGKKIAEMEEPTLQGNVTIAAANNTWAVVTTNTGRVAAIDYANGKLAEDIDNIPSRGEAAITGPIAISPDGKRFAIGIGGEPFTTYGVRIYDLAAKKELHTFIGHAGPVSALEFTPDGNYLASGAQDTSVIVWGLTKLAKGN